MGRAAGRFSTVVDVATAIALVAAVVVFARRELAARRAPGPPAAAAALVGVPMPVLDATDSTGAARPIDVAAAGVTHLLLLFRSDCSACAMQKPAWLELAARLSALGVRVYAVTGEPRSPAAASYLGGAGVESRFVRDPAPISGLGLTVVPATLLVGADGRIADARIGVAPDFESMITAVGAADTLEKPETTEEET